mgnify:CR=1 FL=1
MQSIENKTLRIVSGAEERWQSVFCGLQCVKSSSLVLVHDAARPFASPELFNRVLQAAMQYGAACCGMPLTDTLKEVNDLEMVQQTIPREKLWAIQTPQAFDTKALLRLMQAVDSAMVRRTKQRAEARGGGPHE